jgi:transposase
MLRQTKRLKRLLKKLKIESIDILADPISLIFFFDEGRFGLQSTITRIWAKKGSYVQAKVKQGYKSFYCYSCVSPLSGESFSLFLPEVNTEMMNIYIKEISRQYAGKNIFIILDQAGWHKAKDLRLPKNIKLRFLPPYSPELNPIEKLWKWLRKEVTHNQLFETLEELMDALENEFRKLKLDKYKKLCHCSYL